MSLDSSKSNHRFFAKVLKKFRELHRKAGAIFFVFFFVMAISGLVLGWKKNAGDLIMPSDRKGVSTELSEWKSLAELQALAYTHLKDSLAETTDVEIGVDRMDVRPSKGMVKVRIEPGYWEVQIDGKTGSILSVGKRYSDLFEKIHDGSIVEDLTRVDGFKLVYSSVTGLVLILFTVTGFWMWYGPKRMRAKLKEHKASSRHH